jgi:glycyl-tRNA synthetase
MGDRMDTIVSLAKRRGLVYPSSDIYGGLRAAWDYGPLGVEMKNNLKREWWKAVVQRREDVVGLDSSVILSPQVWQTSGHVTGFSDPLTECLSCHSRFRADQLEEAYAAAHHDTPPPRGLADCSCPQCGTRGSFTEPRQFNGMLKTFLGPVDDESGLAYLRPETAQGIFINFKNVLQFSRKKPPFGIAQVGKSFRNEITPGNFIFRTREFEQMEMEFFVPPPEAGEWFEYWTAARREWYLNLGIRADHLRLRPHDADELSHYSSQTSDIEYLFPIGWSELEGIANRGDFDLRQHAEYSGETLEYFDQGSGERYVPHVIEPAAGADRATLAFLVDAYDEEDLDGETRTVLRLHPRLAPVKAAILPLLRKNGQPELAREIHQALRDQLQCEYDEGGSIGRRYRRQDEIGTPWCVTIDHESVEAGTVTVRDRDSLAQERLAIDELAGELTRRLATPWNSPKA